MVTRIAFSALALALASTLSTSLARQEDGAAPTLCAHTGEGMVIVPGRHPRDFLNLAMDLEESGDVIFAAMINRERVDGVAVGRIKRDGSVDSALLENGDLKIISHGASAQPIIKSLSGDMGFIVSQDNKRSVRVFRFHPDGKPVAQFGSDGSIYESDFMRDIYAFGDGRLLAATQRDGGRHSVTRYRANGRRDVTFANAARFRSDAMNGINQTVSIRGILAYTSGDVLLFGNTTTTKSSRKLWFRRLRRTGAIDTDFGQSGTVQIGFPGASHSKMGRCILDSHNRIVVSGVACVNSVLGAAMARLKPDGSIDTQFARNGYLMTPLTRMSSNPPGAIIAETGEGGYILAASHQTRIKIIKYLDDGALDKTFGKNGMSQVRYSKAWHTVPVAIRTNRLGQILIGANTSPETNFILVRLKPNGSPLGNRQGQH